MTLPETAPCFEALRVYLILPFCHIFENEESFETVSAPFAQAATRLKKTADGKVLDYWILHIGKKFVQRILEVTINDIQQFHLILHLVIQTIGNQNNPNQ